MSQSLIMAQSKSRLDEELVAEGRGGCAQRRHKTTARQDVDRGPGTACSADTNSAPCPKMFPAQRRSLRKDAPCPKMFPRESFSLARQYCNVMSAGARCSGGSARQEVDRGPGDACIHRYTLMCKKCPVLRFANRIPCLGVICVIGMVAQCEGAGWTDATMSVMTGSTSVFPAPSGTGNIKVPDSLKVRYKQPEAYHPKLRFWFTPDVFEELNVADGTAVASWRNIANICHPAHSSAECTGSVLYLCCCLVGTIM